MKNNINLILSWCIQGNGGKCVCAWERVRECVFCTPCLLIFTRLYPERLYSDCQVSFSLAHHSTGVTQYLLHVWVFFALFRHTWKMYGPDSKPYYNIMPLSEHSVYYMAHQRFTWLFVSFDDWPAVAVTLFFFREPISYIIIIFQTDSRWWLILC